MHQVDCTTEWPATMWFNLSYKYQQVLINLKKIPAMLMGEVMNDYHAKTGSAAAAALLHWLRSWFLALWRPHPQAGHPGPLPGMTCGWMALAALYPWHPLLLCCSPSLLLHCDCHLQHPQDLARAAVAACRPPPQPLQCLPTASGRVPVGGAIHQHPQGADQPKEDACHAAG
ncbi:uncharacterized protein LOC144116280 isoform X3 [Amblyomma americanum]